MGRRSVLVAVVAALLAAGPARADSLAGQTTIASARPGAVAVHLDKTLKFDEDSFPKATIEGQSAWRALALVGAHGFLVAAADDDGSFLGTTGELEPGDYRFFVVTDDGVPVTATLKLPGLDGQVGLTPSAILSVHQSTPAPHASPSFPDTTVIGTIAATHAGGMGVDAIDVAYPAPSGGRAQHCFYEDPAAASAPDGFDVGCPGGEDWDYPSTGFGSPFVAVTGYPGDSSRTYWFNQSGAFGEGVNVTAGGGAPKLTESARWIDFGDEGEPVPAAPAPEQPAAPAPAPSPPAAATTLPCPHSPLRLPAAFRAGAARAALHGRHGLQAIATRAAGAGGARIAAACGRAVASRTAVVKLRGRGTVETAYLARGHHGWRVWWSERRQLSP